MGAIGNYIHLTYGGYVEHKGLQFGPYLRGIGNIIAGRERSFNNWINKSNHSKLEVLEKQINADLNILNKIQGTTINGDYPSVDEVEQALLEDIGEQLPDRYFRVDLLAAAVEGLLSGGSLEAGLAPSKGKSNASATQQMIATQVNSQLNRLIDMVINEVESIMIAKGVPQKVIESQVNRSKGKLNTFIGNLNQMSKTISTDNIRVQKQLNNILYNLEGQFQNINGENIDNTEIKNLIAGFTAGVARGIGADTAYKGAIGEAVTAASAGRLIQTVGEEIIDTVKVVGDHASSGIIVKDNITPALQSRISNFVNGFSINNEDYTVMTEGSQHNKVDVVVSFKNNKNMNISVKNYSPKSIDYGFENKTGNLFALIQNENKNDFINHYLNLTGIKDFRNDGNRANIVKLIKKIVVAKLITGYNTLSFENGSVDNMATANVFAVYQTGNYGAQVKLYNMGDILKTLFNGERYNNINIPEYLYDANKKVNPRARGNEKVTAIQTRLTNMLSQLNRQVSYTFYLNELTKD